MMATYPDVKPSLHQDKWQHFLSVRETDPDLAIHQKAMVHVYDTLLYAGGARIDPRVFLASFPRKPMDAQEVPIVSLDDMFLGRISEQLAQLDKVGCVPDRFRHLCVIFGQYFLDTCASGQFFWSLLEVSWDDDAPFFFSDSFLSPSGPHLLNKRREAL
jgi:hypothetical protein